MSTISLLRQYYSNMRSPAVWQDLLADDFRFIGGDMTKPEPVIGKQAYLGIVGRLSALFSSVELKQTFIDGDHAVVLAHYDWTFPKAGKVPGSVAEFWTISQGKLQELAIFFDTLNFDRLTKG